ncbi:MAG: hypothetical protein AB3N14_01535 [Flavobacteriaceae bacterium]
MSNGGVTPALTLALACAFLILLIFGQGTYLFKLEKEMVATQLEADTYRKMLEVSLRALHAEVRIPYVLVEWERNQLQPREVPEKQLSKYRSWNSARLAEVLIASGEWRRFREKDLPSDLEISARTMELEGFLRDLEARYKSRVREDVLAELEGE